MSIVGSTLIFQGWRLDPLLLLCQALTTSVAFWYGLETFRLRSKEPELVRTQPWRGNKTAICMYCGSARRLGLLTSSIAYAQGDTECLPDVGSLFSTRTAINCVRLQLTPPKITLLCVFPILSCKKPWANLFMRANYPSGAAASNGSLRLWTLAISLASFTAVRQRKTRCSFLSLPHLLPFIITPVRCPNPDVCAATSAAVVELRDGICVVGRCTASCGCSSAAATTAVLPTRRGFSTSWAGSAVLAAGD